MIINAIFQQRRFSQRKSNQVLHEHHLLIPTIRMLDVTIKNDLLFGILVPPN